MSIVEGHTAGTGTGPGREHRQKRTMITKIHSATIVVSNQEAAVDFYVNTLG